MKEAASGSMPGMELYAMSPAEVYENISGTMAGYRAVGAVTGIPSLRRTVRGDACQTLDPLAFGLRDLNGRGERLQSSDHGRSYAGQ